jgi:4-hydroxy-3-methylbut-2-enyl diphosphate reductase
VRAIDIVNMALTVYEKPLYVRKEIVHNPYVVEDLRAKGAVFVDSLDEVPVGGTVVFSAHGVAPEVWKEAQAKGLRVIDATCPLVTKVHMEALRYARQDHTIVLIGHRGHDEVIGTMGEAPDHMRLATSVQDVEQLVVADPDKVAYVTQTTLSLEDTREIVAALRRRFPSIEGPPSADICYATQNRQTAVREIARKAQVILVVGARNSSNSNRLMEEARRAGARSFLINDMHSIDPAWFEGVTVVGVTSGASTPEVLVTKVLAFFQQQGAQVEEAVMREENVQFALPPELATELRGAQKRACEQPQRL